MDEYWIGSPQKSMTPSPTSADIDTDMGDAGSIVCAHEKDKIARLCVAAGNRGTDIVKPLSAQPPGVDESAVGKNIGDKAGAVKRSGRV